MAIDAGHKVELLSNPGKGDRGRVCVVDRPRKGYARVQFGRNDCRNVSLHRLRKLPNNAPGVSRCTRDCRDG